MAPATGHPCRARIAALKPTGMDELTKQDERPAPAGTDAVRVDDGETEGRMVIVDTGLCRVETNPQHGALIFGELMCTAVNGQACFVPMRPGREDQQGRAVCTACTYCTCLSASAQASEAVDSR